MAILMDVIFFFLMSYSVKCHHLEDLNSSLNQSFPNDVYMMLENHAWVKDSFTCASLANGFDVCNRV